MLNSSIVSYRSLLNSSYATVLVDRHRYRITPPSHCVGPQRGTYRKSDFPRRLVFITRPSLGDTLSVASRLRLSVSLPVCPKLFSTYQKGTNSQTI